MSSLGLTDKPVSGIEFERLGMKDYVDAMSEFVRTCQTPMTIAIQGDWGTGKTSMMNMVKEDLEKKGGMKVETRWFNTWQYAQFQEQDEIAISLLSGFMDQLGDQARNARQALANVGKKATGFVSGLAKAIVDVGAGAGGDMVKDALDKLAESEMDSAKQLRNLKNDIANSVSEVLKKSGSDRMVVFIDDLDRIVPARAVEILETIKLFMDVDKCVFVLAVDYHVVSKGLEQKFGITMDDMKGKSFFDKIIQLPFNLPVAQYKIRDYMRELFKGSVQFSEESLGILVRLAEFSIGTNPRSLKRLLNATQLLNIVAGKQGKLDGDAVANKEERQRILFAVLCLQLAYEAVYSVILRNAGGMNADYLDSLCDIERIGDLREVIEALRRSVPPGVDQSEHVARFSTFMSAFKDSIQLVSDSEGANVVSQAEFEILRQFLMLSSITSTASIGSGAPVDVPANKALVSSYFIGEFSDKYRQLAASFSGELKRESYRGTEYLGIEYVIGVYRCTIWFGWLPDRLVVYIGSSPDTPTKHVFCNFFRNEMSGKFPNIEFKNLKSNDYIILDKIITVDGDTEEAVFARYKDMISAVMDILQPDLLSLRDRKLPEISRLIGYASKVSNALKESFSSREGWQVDGGLDDLRPGRVITIKRESWNDKFSLQLIAELGLINNFYFGLKKANSTVVLDKGAEAGVVARCKDGIFDYPGTCWIGGDNIFSKQLPGALYQSYRGYILVSDGSLVHQTIAEEDAAVQQVVEILSRFKQILPELDKLAQSA